MASQTYVGSIDTLDSVTFDALLAQQDPFGEPGCRFDLRTIGFVTPAGLVQLAAACHNLHAMGRKPVIALRNRDVVTYMLRAGFIATVRPFVQFNPPIKRTFLRKFEDRRGANPMLIEVTRIDPGRVFEQLVDRTVDAVQELLDFPINDAFDVAIVLSEIGQNTFDHNGSACGFVAMQAYRRRAGYELELSVADCGAGLLATLTRNEKHSLIATDAAAIEAATTLGTSEFDDPTRGTGLYHLLEIAYKHGGMAQIRSGTAKVRYRMDQKKGWGFHVPEMPGVQIVLSLPAKGER